MKVPPQAAFATPSGSDELLAVTACDLFSGAGGFSLGALLAGIDVVAAVEWDSHACSTYRTNLIENGKTEARLFEADLTELSPCKLMDDAGIQGCDVLLGGPPCQGFSTHRIKGAGINDPRNKLLFRYFEYVRILRPAFFLVENVPGMLWPRHSEYIQKFYSLARSAKYELLQPQLVNARDFGVPQNRRRVFILGYDADRVEKPPSWPPRATHGPPGKSDGLLPWATAARVFSRSAPADDLNDVHMKHGSALVEAFKNTPPNGGSRSQSGRTLPCHEGHDGHKDVYGRIDPSLPAPTMTTACINPSKGRFVHPTEHHGITLRQAARIQSFPDWFQFQGGLISGGVQIGNAVPVDLATALLRPLREAVLHMRARAREAA